MATLSLVHLKTSPSSNLWALRPQVSTFINQLHKVGVLLLNVCSKVHILLILSLTNLSRNLEHFCLDTIILKRYYDHRRCAPILNADIGYEQDSKTWGDVSRSYTRQRIQIPEGDLDGPNTKRRAY